MEKIRVLLVTGVVTCEHDLRKMNENLRLMLESTGRFEVRITEEFNGVTEATLTPYDLIVLNYDGKNFPTDPYKRWIPETESVFMKWVENGKGLMIHHSACWLEDDMPEEYAKMWGIYLAMPESRRRPCDDALVRIMAPQHPIMQGITDFAVTGDDFFTGVYSDEQARPVMLAGIMDDLETYVKAEFPPKHHPVKIPEGGLPNMRGVGTMQPIAWTNTFGRGRVFACSIGHDIDTYRRVGYLTMFVRGCEWAATGEVTLHAPDRSGDNRLLKWPFYRNS